MKKILRYISGQTFEMEKQWGINQLHRILMMQDMNQDIFEAEKEQARQVDYFTRDGFFLGTNLTSIPKKSIARISMSGVMMTEDGMCSIGMVSLDKIFRQAYSNSSVDGIMFRVNTGGGQSSASDILFNTISDRNKPVVTHGTLIASAGVGGTLKSDEIVLESDSSFMGSIGTMMSLRKSILEPENNGYLDLYSKKSKNKNKEYREAQKGNLEPFIEMLTRNDELFMNKVSKNRPLKGALKMRRETLSGGLFDGIGAKNRGLADGIGSFNYALKRLNSHISYK